jgi:hypothetical protein
MSQAHRPLPASGSASGPVGTGLSLLGVLLLLAAFPLVVPDFVPFDDEVMRLKALALPATGGLVLLFVGQLLLRLGTGGWAGWGMVLDRQQARQDLQLLSTSRACAVHVARGSC